MVILGAASTSWESRYPSPQSHFLPSLHSVQGLYVCGWNGEVGARSVWVGKGVLAWEICWQTERENCREKARELAKRGGEEVEKHEEEAKR